MFGLRFSKDNKETEALVIGFITTRFCDPYPGFPLSKDVIIRIFSKEFLDTVIAFSKDIAEGYKPSKQSIKELFLNCNVDFRSFCMLTVMIYNYLLGLQMPLREIEAYKLGYDFKPDYYSSEEYRHIQFLYSFFIRIINYME